MSIEVYIHRTRTMTPWKRNNTTGITLTTEAGEAHIFFNDPLAMVRRLRECLHAALEVQSACLEVDHAD